MAECSNMMGSIPEWSTDSAAFPKDCFLQCTSHPSITLAEVMDQGFCGYLDLQEFDQISPPEENLMCSINNKAALWDIENKVW